MTDQDRKDRIEHLRQGQERKHFLPAFLTAMSEIAGQPGLEEFILSQEETNIFLGKINDKESQVPVLSIRFPFAQAERLRDILGVLKPELARSDNFLSTNRFFKTYFLKLDTSFVISKFEALV